MLKQIKSDEKLRMIPVVVLTSSHEEKDMVASYKLGVNAYVVKPVDFHEFVNAIRELGDILGSHQCPTARKREAGKQNGPFADFVTWKMTRRMRS